MALRHTKTPPTEPSFFERFGFEMQLRLRCYATISKFVSLEYWNSRWQLICCSCIVVVAMKSMSTEMKIPVLTTSRACMVAISPDLQLNGPYSCTQAVERHMNANFCKCTRLAPSSTCYKILPPVVQKRVEMLCPFSGYSTQTWNSHQFYDSSF